MFNEQFLVSRKKTQSSAQFKRTKRFCVNIENLQACCLMWPDVKRSEPLFLVNSHFNKVLTSFFSFNFSAMVEILM